MFFKMIFNFHMVINKQQFKHEKAFSMRGNLYVSGK